MNLLHFFRTGPDKPLLPDRDQIRRIYERKRIEVFASIVIGYTFFYVCRLSFSAVKKPMLDAGILNADQMGKIGSALFFSYAIGKLINGFLCDRTHVGRFIASGLLASAVTILFFGANGLVGVPLIWLFTLLWGLNGWFQSMGSAPCGAALSYWYSNNERGTWYGLWSASHSLGGAFNYVVTATIAFYFGWRWGFWSAGLWSLAVALILYKTLADRPQTLGLPPVADYRNDHGEAPAKHTSVGRAQLEVVKNPYVWILGFSCVAMYIARYGIDSWGMLFLQESKGYDLIGAGFILSTAKLVETCGSVFSGIISDRFFGARRNVATLMYGLFQTAGLLVLFLSPSTQLGSIDLALKDSLRPGVIDSAALQAITRQGISIPQDCVVAGTSKNGDGAWTVTPPGWFGRWTGYRIVESSTELIVGQKYNLVHFLGLFMFGFGLGGMLVFLGGLIAIDICPKRAAGAAMGFVGMFSYLGAAVQDRVSGALLEAGKMTLHGQATHNFSAAFLFWLVASVMSVLLSSLLWKVKAKD